jgi:hypothetical protein
MLAGIVLVMLSSARTSATGANPADSRPVPVFLFLRIATDEVQASREERFATELGLTLDAFKLKVVEAGAEDFTSLALDEQIRRVRPIVERHRADAAGWIVAKPPGILLLHVLATSRGRALVRQVEAELVPGCEATLALATRELLESTHLLEEAAPPKAATEKAHKETGPDLLLSVSTSLGGGLAGQQGPSTVLGGKIGLDLRLTPNLIGTVSVSAWGGPLQSLDSGEDLLQWGIMPGVELLYGFVWGRISFGPRAGLHLAWSNLDMTLGSGPSRSFRTVEVLGSLGAELRWHFFDSVGIVVSTALGFHARQQVYSRLSDESVALATPWVDWMCSVGMVFSLGAVGR